MAAFSPEGRGTAARAAATATSGRVLIRSTGSDRVRVASSGMQMSLQTSRETAAFSCTGAPTRAETGAVIGIGR